MIAFRILKEAAKHGVRFALDGDTLKMRAPVKPTEYLLAEIRLHKAKIKELLRAAPLAALRPRIKREPPFGCGHVPRRFEAAFEALFDQCPLGVEPFTWVAAIYDAGTLFGDFGQLLDGYRWLPGDLFDVPHDDTQGGLAWFIHGSPVVAVGQTMAVCSDGRIWWRARR